MLNQEEVLNLKAKRKCSYMNSHFNDDPYFFAFMLQARIAFLKGERKGQENLKQDLVRRIKMLEFALKQERYRTLTFYCTHILLTLVTVRMFCGICACVCVCVQGSKYIILHKTVLVSPHNNRRINHFMIRFISDGIMWNTGMIR